MTLDAGRYRDRPLTPDDAAFVSTIHRAPHAARFVHAPTDAELTALASGDATRARVVLDSAGNPVGFIAMSHLAARVAAFERRFRNALGGTVDARGSLRESSY